MSWTIANSTGEIKIEGGHAPLCGILSYLYWVLSRVHTTLLKNGLLDSEFDYGYNDTKFRWVCKQKWKFTTQLSIPQTNGRVFLVFHGLDTVSTIRSNKILIGHTDNMHIKYVFEVSNLLKNSDDDKLPVQIEFEDMVEYAKREKERYPYHVPDDTTPASNGEKYRNYTRKEQCSFSWDWGPCFMPIGIYRPVDVVCLHDSVWIRDMCVQILSSGSQWEIKVLIDYETHFDRNVEEIEFILSCNSVETRRKVSIKQSFSTLSLFVLKDNVQQWYPNGFGSQILYELRLSFIDPKAGQIKPLQSRNIGFRSVELVQDLDHDQKGSNFAFRINGIEIFAKGSNIIPMDLFQSRVDLNKIQKLVRDAVDANFNMLRVWGGGVYMPQEFYEECDRCGILVWQEFMFACGMYPVNKEFLESVRHETLHQVKRLSHHPSICLWSGNNENETALVTGWFVETRFNPYLYSVDYHILYHETIMNIVKSLDKSRDFISSSPSNGMISKEPFVERYKAENPLAFGDVHYYNYKDNGTLVKPMPICRFSSEYGFQSMPWPSSSATITDDLADPFSAFWKQRNHRANGQDEILYQIRSIFPKVDKNNFEAFSLLSQLAQALCVKAQTEHYRRLSPYCMGALYWQFNDVWTAPTWSGIQSDGKWKILQNYAKDFFEPILISAFHDPESKELFVHLSNNYMRDVGGKLRVYGYKVHTNERLLDVYVDNVFVHANSSTKVETIKEFTHESDVIIFLEFMETGGNGVLHENFYHVCKINNHSMLEKPTVKYRFLGKEGQEFKFSITTDKPSWYTIVEISQQFAGENVKGRFHPNGFHLLPGMEKVIGFRPFDEAKSINDNIAIEIKSLAYL